MRRRRVIFAALSALTLVVPPTASRAQTLDQTWIPSAGGALFGSADNYQGQTFKPLTNSSGGAGFWVRANSTASGTISAQLWSHLASNPAAQMLASGSASFSVIGGTQLWLDVFWNSTVVVTPGAQYFLSMIAGTTALTTRQSQVTNPDGQAYYNFSPTNPTNAYTCCNAGLDLAFRAYSTSGRETVAPPVVVTPEPASVVLLATGLLALVGVARRRIA